MGSITAVHGGITSNATGSGGLNFTIGSNGPNVAPQRFGFTADLSGIDPAYFTTQPPANASEHDARIHGFEYEWSFGVSGTYDKIENVKPEWRQRNRAIGFFADYTYPDHGAFDVILTVTELSSGKSLAAMKSVTVADPGVVFSGTNTVCYSPDPGETTWEGAPAGSFQTTDPLDETMLYPVTLENCRLAIMRTTADKSSVAPVMVRSVFTPTPAIVSESGNVIFAPNATPAVTGTPLSTSPDVDGI